MFPQYVHYLIVLSFFLSVTCKFRESASCTRVGIAPCSGNEEPFLQSQQGAESEDEDAPLPVTSYTCQWVQPRKRKESTAKVSETSFMKHVYGRTRKHELAPISNFDPRPPEYRGTMSTRVPAYLEKVKGLGIGYSVLTDTSLQIWSDDSTESTVDLPTKTELSQRVSVH